MRWALLVGVLGLAGCDQAFGLTTVGPSDAVATDDGAHDANIPLLPCRVMTDAPYFCADFDQGSPSYFQDGTMFAIPLAGPTDAPWMVLPPAVSAPNAWHIDDTTGDQYYLELEPAHADVSVLTASFDLDLQNIPVAPNGDAGVMWLETSAPAGNCIASFGTNNGVDLIMSSYCGASQTYEYITVVQGIPSGWNHVEMTLDTVAGNATVAFGARPLLTLDLMATTPGGKPFIRVGAIGGSNTTAGPKVGLDNVIITVR